MNENKILEERIEGDGIDYECLLPVDEIRKDDYECNEG